MKYMFDLLHHILHHYKINCLLLWWKKSAEKREGVVSTMALISFLMFSAYSLCLEVHVLTEADQGNIVCARLNNGLECEK